MILFAANVNAQYDYNDDYGTSSVGPDRYFYDENFDWRWDVRVRISDGIDNGNLTRREADRLYDRLERIERKEYAYQSDGYLSAYEQDEIWDDVVNLNRLIGIELRDWDRTYYGYSARGLSYRGYSPWYFGNSYDFYRFDRRGYGSISLGYRPRAFFPRNHVYYRNRSYSSNWNNRNNNWNNGSNNWNNGNNNWGNNRNNNWNKGSNWDNNRSNNHRNEDRNNSRNNSGSRDSRALENKGSSDRWGNDNGSRGNVPNTTPQRNESRTQPSGPSTREREGNRREEILTPRSSDKSSDNGSSRGSDSGRRSLPDRGKTNDSGRGGNNF
jgi:hypothetical protein